MSIDYKTVDWLYGRPVEFAGCVGYNLLTDIHNDWMRAMLMGSGDYTLQAHRGSYKTSCVAVALAIIIMTLPEKRILFLRKTDGDVREVLRQVSRILQTPYAQEVTRRIWGVSVRLTTDISNAINTNLAAGVKGSDQLTGLGLGSSLTGKHFDLIYTDDIVNVNDRISKAERDRTKLIYQELQNVRNRGGRIINTGTPWHIEDCFTIMPEPAKYDCYTTGLMNDEDIRVVRDSMTASLFAANYELRHIASDDVIFTDPVTGADPALAEQGRCHVDAAYSGEDYTAFTIVKKRDGKYYVFGKLWPDHVDNHMDDIARYREKFCGGAIYCETNADKGYLAKALRARGERCHEYHEKMNKYIKITSWLKAVWKDVIFVEGTDQAYIDQICDYTEYAEHDDAPDSLASLIRELWGWKEVVRKPEVKFPFKVDEREPWDKLTII